MLQAAVQAGPRIMHLLQSWYSSSRDAVCSQDSLLQAVASFLRLTKAALLSKQ